MDLRDQKGIIPAYPGFVKLLKLGLEFGLLKTIISEFL